MPVTSILSLVPLFGHLSPARMGYPPIVFSLFLDSADFSGKWCIRDLWHGVQNEQSKFPASDSAILCWCVCVEGGRWAWRTKMEPRSGSLPKSWKTRHLTFWSQKALLPTNTTGYFTEYQKRGVGQWGNEEGGWGLPFQETQNVRGGRELDLSYWLRPSEALWWNGGSNSQSVVDSVWL